MASSRKMGTYYMATLLFKTYFKVSESILTRRCTTDIGTCSSTRRHCART
jgi:hypothetical protein